ncbi:GreA/GreB family elongation factor, partial [Chloroflexota bacterium]
DKELCQQEVYRFIRWYGRERSFVDLTAPEVAKYTEQLSSADTDYVKKLEHVRAFLTYAKKEGWNKTNLAIHLKAKKAEVKIQSTAKRGLPNSISLTQEGFTELESELAELKIRSSQAIEEIRKAAADKDFRENAPLHAAREQRGHLEGRIKELEEILKSAVIIDDKKKKITKVVIGDNVMLYDLDSGGETRYMIVSPREVDPAMGKISNASPVGKAIIGRGDGEIIEVAVPAGKKRYRINKIES